MEVLMLAEQHPDPAPADALEGPDPVEKEKQRAIAMKDVVVTEGIESSPCSKLAANPPSALDCSTMVTFRQPARASVYAVATPARPPPMTTVAAPPPLGGSRSMA
jgi:hypothetical protein